MVNGGDRHQRFRWVGMFIVGLPLVGCEAIVNDGSLKERPAGAAESDLPLDADTSDVTDASGSDSTVSDGSAEAAVEDGNITDSQSGPDVVDGSSPEDAGPTAGDAPTPNGEAAAQDSGPASDATAPDDAAPPPDASSADSALAALDAGPAGCSPGAVVIPMTKLNTTYKFNTVAAVCVTYKGYVSGWNGSNMQGRSVTVIGATTRTLATIAENALQPSVAPSSDGYIYWNFSIGIYAYSSMDAFP